MLKETYTAGGKNYPATNPINQLSFDIEPTTKKHQTFEENQ